MCSCSASDVWRLLKVAEPDVDKHASIFRLMGRDVIDQETSWLCNCCTEIIRTSEPYFTIIQQQSSSCNDVIAQRAELLTATMGTINSKGCVYSLEVIANLKSMLVNLGKTPSEITQEVQLLHYYLGRDGGFSTYSKGTKLGKVIYNNQVFSQSVIQYVHELHAKEWKIASKYTELEEQSLRKES